MIMFDNIKLVMEREAVRDSNHVINNLKISNYQTIAHHLSSLMISFIAFLLTLYAVVSYRQSEGNIPTITLVTLFIAFVLIFLHENKKRTPEYINKFLSIFMWTRIVWLKYWHADYLAKYYWISLGALTFVLIFLMAAHSLGADGWVDKLVMQDKSYSSSINMLFTLAWGLLATQIALFSFMMQQVLGKYSGVVAQTVVSHKAIKVLMVYPLLGLLIPYSLSYYGCPISIKDYIFPITAGLLLFGLLISAMLARTGLRESLAIRYVGIADAIRIKKAMPPPINNKSISSRYLWLPLNYLGLDFRDRDRYQIMSAPKTGSNITTESLGALLGVANKAIIEGQHDVFVASLSSIERIMEGYAEGRSLYFGHEDHVFTYLNYQFAALIESASKAPNQYLISNLTEHIGRISKLTYCIGNYPKSDESSTPWITHSNNFPTSLWMGLLFQSFENTHKLTRSTAAHESIIQMTELAIISIDHSDSDAITLSYLETIKKVYALCLPKLADPYHEDLTGMCFINLIRTLMYISQNRSSLTGTHQDPFEETLKLLSQMTMLYLDISPSTSINFNDPINAFLTKTEEEKYCIQEIFFVTLFREIKNRRDYAIAISDLKELIETNTKLGKTAISKEVYLSGYYLDALFEMAYMILRGMPAHFMEYDAIENSDMASFRQVNEQEDSQRNLIILVFENLREIYVEFYKSERVMRNWQQSVFSILGVAIIRYSNTKDNYLKDQIEETGWLLYALVAADYYEMKRPPYDSKNYLQLLGSWLDHFKICSELSQEICELIATTYTPRGMYGGSSDGNYGRYNYPTISHRDFYLYPLNNIRHDNIMPKSKIEEFLSWERSLMQQDSLLKFYKRTKN